MADEPILVINSGSSSLKFGLYVQRDGEEQAVLDGLADGIGRDSGKLELKDAQGQRCAPRVYALHPKTKR